MAMPRGVETYRHYPDMKSFQRHEDDMARQGWTTEAIAVREIPRSPIRRLLRRPARVEVDAHYLRANWTGNAEN